MFRRYLLGFLALLTVATLPLSSSNSATVLINNYIYAAANAAPGGVSGLVFWGTAKDSATLTNAGGGAISAWADKLGSGNTLTQSNNSYRPLTGTQTINGFNALEFDGAGDRLYFPSAMFPVVDGDYTIYVLGRNRTTGTGVGVITQWRGTGGEMAFRSDSGDTVMNGGIGAGSSGSTPSHVSDTDPHIFRIYKSGSTGYFSRDHLISSPITSYNVTGVSDALLGGYWDTTLFSTSLNIGEVLVYNKAVNSAEDIAIRTYLKTEWGIAPSPSDVPDLGLWLDAAKAGSINASSGAVNSWTDLSGNSRNCTASSTARPTTGSTTLNGLNTLSFNGSSNTFTCTNSSLNGGPNTIVIVHKPASTSTSLGLFYNNGTLGSTQNYAIRNQAMRIGATTTTRTTATSGSGMVQMHTNDATGNPITQTLKVGDDTEITASANWGGPATALTLVQNTFATEVAEVIVWHRVLTKAEKNLVGNYVEAKWGVPWTDIP